MARRPPRPTGRSRGRRPPPPPRGAPRRAGPRIRARGVRGRPGGPARDSVLEDPALPPLDRRRRTRRGARPGPGRATPVAVLSGRVHLYEGHRPADVVFPARLLARLGVGSVVLTNAAGGIRRSFRPGNLMVLSDHINALGANPLTGVNEEALGPRFPDMSAAYDPKLRALAKAHRPDPADPPAGGGLPRDGRAPPTKRPRRSGPSPGGARTRSGCPRCPRRSRCAMRGSGSSGSRRSRTWRRASCRVRSSTRRCSR